MDLQKAFDQGFDAVKAYVDGITDQVEERLIELEEKTNEAQVPELHTAASPLRGRRSIPQYPAHLTPEEQIAVFEKVERDLRRRILPDGNKKKTASLETLVRLASTLLVRDAWMADRIAALEAKEAKR